MPTLASNIQTQDYSYAIQVPAGTWRWTTRVDVSQATPQFQILNVVSPFGLLRDSIPLPGQVVQSMANSITELMTAFAPTIVLSPTSLTFTLDEGRGFGQPQVVTVSNGGVYGSLLAVSVTSDSAFMQVSPANVSSLAFNSSGQFSVTVDSTTLLAADSPYTAELTLQDVNATNNPQTIPVNIIVRPKAVISLSPLALNFHVTRNVDGTFPAIPSQTFQVQNAGGAGSSLAYQIQKLTGISPWLVSFSPPYGTLASSASQTVTVVSQPIPNMQCGVYTDSLRVSGYSTNSYQDVVVTLTIS